MSRKIALFLHAVRMAIESPINRGRPFSTLWRIFSWQIRSRLANDDLIVPFVGEAKLVGRSGMTGMTLNIYLGLHEPEPMGLLLHLLRPGDLFVDVGANVGTYTILASAACGAHSIACEPIPASMADVRKNISVNKIEALAECYEGAIGDEADSTVIMTGDRGAMNRVLEEEDSTGHAEIVEVPATTLNVLLNGRAPTMIKFDVEGYEEKALDGAREVLAQPSLLAITMEAWAGDESDRARRENVFQRIVDAGFTPVTYNPIAREVSPIAGAYPRGDIIFLRDPDAVKTRIQAAPRRAVARTTI